MVPLSPSPRKFHRRFHCQDGQGMTCGCTVKHCGLLWRAGESVLGEWGVCDVTLYRVSLGPCYIIMCFLESSLYIICILCTIVFMSSSIYPKESVSEHALFVTESCFLHIRLVCVIFVKFSFLVRVAADPKPIPGILCTNPCQKNCLTGQDINIL